MRHRKSVKKLGRTAAHRRATLSNLAAALFERKHIQTTEAKAKETRRVSERLITLAKKGTIHARRLALRKLHHKKIVKILFDEIAPQYADRPGGYTRVVKLGQRPGDGARMAVLELVGYETASKKKKAKDKEKEAKSETKKKRTKSSEVEEMVPDVDNKEEKKKSTSKKTSDVNEEDDRAGAEAEKKDNKEEKKRMHLRKNR